MQEHNWTVVIVMLEAAAKYQYLDWEKWNKVRKESEEDSLSETPRKEPCYKL